MACEKFLLRLDNKVDIFCATYAESFNRLVRGLGLALVYIVYVITVFLTLTSFAIILPYEQMYKSPLLLSVLSCFGLYLLVNILFHYGKARTIRPKRNTLRHGTRWCEKCSSFKNEHVHHCGICNRCIVGMDHHCIWINQCVGAHNHRHFFLFIVYLTGATLTIILAGFNTLYDHVYMASSSMNFCSSALSLAPLQPFICSHEGLARTCVIFCYFISLLLFILVGFLTLWNSFLISSGYTYIDYLKQRRNPAKSRGWRDFFNFRGLVGNWKNFFGVHRNRSFSRHILLPTTQPAIPYDDVDDGFDPMDIV